jgi:hypothetical protein
MQPLKLFGTYPDGQLKTQPPLKKNPFEHALMHWPPTKTAPYGHLLACTHLLFESNSYPEIHLIQLFGAPEQVKHGEAHILHVLSAAP